MSLARPIRGIVTPMITPLLGRERLDSASLEQLVEHLISGGVNGIFILGSTGEAPGLSYRLRREVVRQSCSLIRDRAPVFVGISDTASHEAFRMAEFAAETGAAALVYSPPFYYRLSQEMLREHLVRFLPTLPLPVFLYNFPSLTKVQISPETVRFSAGIPNVYGIKDSSGDPGYFKSVVEACSDRRDFALLGGVEELLAEYVASGAHGGVCGGSNLYPRLYVEIYDAAARSDHAEVERLQHKIDQISSGIYKVDEEESSYLRGLKCAASLLGLCSESMAEPYAPFGPEERDRIRQCLLEIHLPGPAIAES